MPWGKASKGLFNLSSRLLVLLGLFYLLYRAVKSWMVSTNTSESVKRQQRAPEIDDIMVKDPFCEVYFPKRNGVRLVYDGQELFFCSTQCRDQFLAARSKKEN